jgi:hypothetical protein
VSVIEFFKRHVDISTAWKAAIFLGVLVFCINLDHGAWAALPAALKQATYTFFVAGFIVRLCENLVLNNSLGMMALPLAVVIPSSIAIGLTFLLHNLKGTPLPFYSTLPTIFMAPPSFLVWAWRVRKNKPELGR